MDENKIRLALTKGRLEQQTLRLLERAGYETGKLKSGSRRLIFSLPDSNLELVLAKAADVLTYVEHGACDIGVVGKDTILEQGGSYYELMDLKFGACRFALAGPRGVDFFKGLRTKTIATKYPNITKRYFADRQTDIRTIKIEGSVELAPLLGLADAIVDIVETGTTLKENGLELYEEILPVSARLIVNLASMKTKRKQLQPILTQLEEQVLREGEDSPC